VRRFNQPLQITSLTFESIKMGKEGFNIKRKDEGAPFRGHCNRLPAGYDKVKKKIAFINLGLPNRI
jgi:hypothetical protein